MSVIHPLSAHVADLIAAGEVVERPASVVKELLENAVDAGAKHVVVELQNGGMTFLRVTDDGCGMAPDDAETAFLRHATSKIAQPEDLSAIHTMGFRGEALAAIASVSRIDLMTRTPAADAGVSLHLDAGAVSQRELVGSPPGTTILVRELFYNTPARMKFMKSDAAEAAAVFSAVQKQALSHPDVAIRLIKDGQEVLATPGDGDLHAAIYCIFGRQFALDLQSVESHWEKITLRGFVTKPGATRGNRSYQNFFVNGRPVKSRLLTAAFEEAYKNQMMTGRFPGCVLHLTLPPDSVDVNVHPAKSEVKFLREHDIFDAVHYGVLPALTKAPARPEVKLPPPAPPQSAEAQARQKDFFRIMSADQYKDLTAKAPLPRTPAPAQEPPAAVVASVISVPRTAPQAPPEPEPQQAMPLPEVPAYRVVGEVLGTYLVIEEADGVVFLDKHAAHERILFEALKAQKTAMMAQTLLSPRTAELTREEAAAVLENAALLQSFGFEAEAFGEGTVVVRQIPAEMDETQAEATLQELAEQLLQGQSASPDGLRDRLLHTIACKAAIKAGYRTGPAERDELVRQVMAREDIKYCPHGRPICIKLTQKSLERQFGRS